MDKNLTYHFTGIKGSGMSSLALILDQEGFKVQGSDVDQYFFTQDNLERAGIPILTFDADNIEEGQFIIQGNAFPTTHEEIQRAQDLNLPIQRYHEFVGQLIENYTSIACTGAHGKTSTTGLMSHVLKGLDKTSYLIGDGTGNGEKDSKYFVLEADEYRRHFHAYHPNYAIVTNIDFDHPDYFKDLAMVMDVYQTFANQVKDLLLVCGDNENARKLQAHAPIKTYGLGEGNDIVAKAVEKTPDGTSFEVVVEGQSLGRFFVPLFGDHSIQNATAVIAFAHYEGLDMDSVRQRLESYPGVKRRFNEKEVNGHLIVDDYAHHPNEIKATIQAAQQRFPDRDIVAVFQPHTFSRTEALMDDFAESLSLADHVYLCPIFASVRETQGNVDIYDLAEKIPGSKVLENEDCRPLLDVKDEVLLFMGAGNIQKYEEAYIDLIK